ncbi:unnamed protein product [Vitrella brassicaformis CCMP3155]|uniref:RxLR effector protein n=1 Tax=Vitrella brassicaformis (strain CCMP3155) TaxID=1169540 RepID=A0A0G4E9B9_VITBC|nr:unnamed protein product [Vitrella brassicaformis CCMP3155]|eukprot:CEL91963.1 unnamed protein product [Vitrella brassicaformis CCMP3155]
MARHWLLVGLAALVCLLSLDTVVCEGGDLPGESVAEVHQDALDPLALDDEAEDEPENKPTDGPNLDAMSDEQKEAVSKLSEDYDAQVTNTLPVLTQPNPSIKQRRLRGRGLRDEAGGGGPSRKGEDRGESRGRWYGGDNGDR